MPKLRLELFRYGSLVFGKVLDQAEELRTNSEGFRELAKEGKLKIVSWKNPFMSEDTLFVRGSASVCDDDVFYYTSSSDSEAIAFCYAIKIMVDRINGEPESNSSVVKVM